MFTETRFESVNAETDVGCGGGSEGRHEAVEVAVGKGDGKGASGLALHGSGEQVAGGEIDVNVIADGYIGSGGGPVELQGRGSGGSFAEHDARIVGCQHGGCEDSSAGLISATGNVFVLFLTACEGGDGKDGHHCKNLFHSYQWILIIT